MRIFFLQIAVVLLALVVLNCRLVSAEQTINLQVVWRHSLNHDEGWMYSVSISSDGQTLAAGTSGGQVVVYSADGAFWDFQTVGQYAEVSISSNGQYIAAAVQATGSSAGALYLFQRNNSTPLWMHFGGSYWDAEISSDGNYIVAGSGGWIYTTDSVYLFEHNNATPVFSYNTSDNVQNVAISSDGSYFAASDDHNIYFFNTTASGPLWTYNIGYGPRTNLAITSDGNCLAAGVESAATEYQGDYLLYFSKGSGNPMWGSRLGGPVYSLTMSSDGSHIATINDDGYVYSYQGSTYAYKYGICVPDRSTGEIFGSNVAMSADGSYFATLSNRTISLFSKSSTTPIYEYQAAHGVWGSTNGRPSTAIASTSAGIRIVGSEFQLGNTDIILIGSSGAFSDWRVLVAIAITVVVVMSVVGLKIRKKPKSVTTSLQPQPPPPPLSKTLEMSHSLKSVTRA